MFVYATESIPTAQGPMTHIQSYQCVIRNENVYKEIISEYTGLKRTIMIEVPKEDLSEMGPGTLSAIIHIDLSKVLFIIDREETDLSISTTDINKDKRFQ